MKYLKNFENNFFPKKQFREINLQLLLVDYFEFDKTITPHFFSLSSPLLVLLFLLTQSLSAIILGTTPHFLLP